jgi:hypothetical protein
LNIILLSNKRNLETITINLFNKGGSV